MCGFSSDISWVGICMNYIGFNEAGKWYLSIPPIRYDLMQYHFNMRSHAQIKTHVWLMQKLLGPVGIPLLGHLRPQVINLALQAGTTWGEQIKKVTTDYMLKICMWWLFLPGRKRGIWNLYASLLLLPIESPVLYTIFSSEISSEWFVILEDSDKFIYITWDKLSMWHCCICFQIM